MVPAGLCNLLTISAASLLHNDAVPAQRSLCKLHLANFRQKATCWHIPRVCCAHSHDSPVRVTCRPAGQGLRVMELLVRISSQQLLAQMNSSLDYSFLDTPRSNATISNHTNIVPREAAANTRIPAFLNTTLIWGGVPVAVGADHHLQPERPCWSTAVQCLDC